MQKDSKMIEIWRNIVGYEGLYQVSNWGRVKNLNYRHTGKERILKPLKQTTGYIHITLYKNKKGKIFLLHRLVAQAFIPNPDNLPIVNHKDEVKTNNFVFVREDGSVDFNKSNLEWCDNGYSIKYGTRNERVAKALSKPVYQSTLDRTFVREWPSLAEIHRQTGWAQANISACCLGKLKSAYGSLWSYIKLSSDCSNPISQL